MSIHDWKDDWPPDDPGFDTMSWILFAAGIVAILLVVLAYVFGLDVSQVHQFTER